MQTYINDVSAAERATSHIVGLFNQGRVLPFLSIDTETSPLPGLTGYPGSEVDDEGKPLKATKQLYLKFAQKVIKGSFGPTMLRICGLHLPMKTTSGKEGEKTAQEAWKLFLARLVELEAQEDETQLLRLARWTEEGLNATIDGLWAEREGLDCREAELKALIATGAKGVKAREAELKKTLARIAEVNEEIAFLDTYARERLTLPLDLKLITHLVKVGVEGRVYLTKEGRNRLDPVQPGLDPYTSTVFLFQATVKHLTGELESWVFNMNAGKVPFEVILPLLKLQNVTYLGQNIKFDLKMLMKHAGYAPKNVFCTQIASRMLLLGVNTRHSLDILGKRWLGLDISKETRSTFIGKRYDEPTQAQLEYASFDTEVLFPLYDKMMARATETGQVNLIETFSKLSWITARWELDGYRIDEDKWLEIARGAARDRDTVAAELEQMLLPPEYMNLYDETPAAETAEGDAPAEDDDDEATPADVRPRAIIRISQTKVVTGQLSRLLGIDLASLDRSGQGKISLEKTSRGNYDREYRTRNKGEGHPFFVKYALWSKLAKQASTYGKRFLWYVHPLTGRIHPTFRIAGTDTARYASTGPNWLNIPAAKDPGDPDFRAAIVSEEGKYWLGADFETMELRIAGDISRDPMVQKMAGSGADAHGFTAASMFHIEMAAVQKPTLRVGEYVRGADRYVIGIWQVPTNWSPEQVADFALAPECVATVKDVKAKYGKDITRTDAKSVTFLWLFQGTPFTLAQRTGLATPHCEGLFTRFAGVYVKMDSHMKDMAEDAVQNNLWCDEFDGNATYAYTVGYNGVRRYVELPYNPHVSEFKMYGAYVVAAKAYQRRLKSCKRELCNLPMQGGNAVITAQALLNLVERGEPWGVLPKMAIYDEIVAETKDKVKPSVVKGLVEGSMLDAANEWMTFVPAGAEADVNKAGKYWRKS